MDNNVNHIQAINFINSFIHKVANETKKVNRNGKNCDLYSF